jgi:selenide,water dikinase
MMASVTLLNRWAPNLARMTRFHAVTDVTGFGILGHALEMARGSNAGVALDYAALPFLNQAEHLTQAGFVTGASTRNWASYGEDVGLPDDYPLWKQQLLTDPQTSGGLRMSCALWKPKGF